MIVGSKFANILQIIGVEGEPGQIIERNFTSPLFHKIVAKEIDLLDIEVRTLSGRYFN